MQAIAEEAQSQSKWKQLGELAMSAGKVLFRICPVVKQVSVNLVRLLSIFIPMHCCPNEERHFLMVAY